MIKRVAAITLLLLFVSGLTASGCYWAWRAYSDWQANTGPDDTSGQGGMIIAGTAIALACFGAVFRIAIGLIR